MNKIILSPISHDICKRIVIDLAPLLILSIITSINIIQIDNYKDSILSRCLITIIGVLCFYKIIDPLIEIKIN